VKEWRELQKYIRDSRFQFDIRTRYLIKIFKGEIPEVMRFNVKIMDGKILIKFRKNGKLKVLTSTLRIRGKEYKKYHIGLGIGYLSKANALFKKYFRQVLTENKDGIIIEFK